MKNRILPITVLVFALAGTVGLQSGCGSTATRESTGEYIDDSAITTKVKAALLKDNSVRAREVNVETYKGTVQLSGFVATPLEKARAAEIAAGVKGVVAVTNNIQLK